MTNLASRLGDAAFQLKLNKATRRTLQRLRREQDRDKVLVRLGFYRVVVVNDQPIYDGLDVMSMFHPSPSSEWLAANVPNTKGRRWRYGATMNNHNTTKTIVWFEDHDDAILFKMKFG
jgi:hypothetical protein